jgi:ribosomal protein L28
LEYDYTSGGILSIKNILIWIFGIICLLASIYYAIKNPEPFKDFPEENQTILTINVTNETILTETVTIEPTVYPTIQNIYFTGWYWVANNSLINVSRCGNLTSLRFLPNLTNYNTTTKNITQVNVSAYNHSLYPACDYNVTNIANKLVNVSFNVNQTKDRYNLTLSGANVTTIFADTTRRVFKYNLSANASVCVNITMTYKNVTNNTGNYRFYINFSGV